MKLYWESYGCSANQADMERILGLLSEKGFTQVARPEHADLIILNTCAVKLTTENRMISRYKHLSKFGVPIIVTGCLPRMNTDRCLKECDGFSAIIDPNSIPELPAIVDRVLSGERGIVRFSDPNITAFSSPKLDLHKVIEIVPISFGCLGSCAFCGVKNVRGRLVSVPITSIRAYFEKALAKGKKEFWITSQDDAIYGWDIGTNLTHLLASLLEVPGEYRIRVGMMNPGGAKSLLPDILGVFADERVYKFIHVPVQSGSDKVLRLMRRQHTVQDFIDVVDAFRSEFPRATISTDIIVGFPGETDNDFEMTVDLIREIKPDIVNLSKFYPRPNTEATKMKKVPTRIISERARFLSHIVDELAADSNKRMVGLVDRLLVSSEKGGQVVGRMFNYKQVFFEGEPPRLGQFVDAEIVSAGRRSLVARVIQNNP